MKSSSSSATDAPTAGGDGAAEPTRPTVELLIVDDNSHVVKALSTLARHAGFTPIAFQSGSEALSYASKTTPAAAVIDVHLPDLNGLIVAQKLRERFGPLTPIIVVSGDTSMETINSLSHVGATHFFSKPVSGQLLLGRLKELIDQGSNLKSEI